MARPDIAAAPSPDEPSTDDARTHLAALAVALRRRGWKAEFTEAGGPAIQVVNPRVPVMTERILCRRTPDRGWQYAWSWREPIGPVDRAGPVADRITRVLRGGDA
jgi:hypothetical protein